MLVQSRSWLSAADTTRSGPNRLRVSAAHDEWNHAGIALLGMHEGFFDREGLGEIELVAFPEDSVGELVDREALQVDLLARGAVDIGIDPRATFVLEAQNDGRPVCIVAARRKTHAFVVFGQKGLQRLEDLRGMTVEQSSPGGATDVMLRQALRDIGLEPDQDVKWHYVSGDMHDSVGTVAEFKRGEHGPAILVTFKDQIADLQAAGYPVLADLRTQYTSRHDRVTAANTDFAEQHPEALKAFLKGMIRSCNWVLDLENGPRFKEVLTEVGYLTSEREARNFDSLFTGWQDRVSRDLTLPRDGIDLIIDEEKRAGKLPAAYSADAVLRLDALQAGQRELGLAEA